MRSVFSAAAVFLLVGITLLAQQQAGKWAEVDEAVNKGLPQTAIEKLQPIIRQALAEKRYPEAIKGIAKKIALEGQIQGNKPEERITRMIAEIEQAPAEMQPMMQAILANWYWNYYQENRWRFLQRTQTTASGNDLTSWDLRRIFAEIDQRFQTALAKAEVLQQIPIATYGDLLEAGNASDLHRPKLYDFLAHNALEFYAAGEQAGARAEDAFDLPSDSAIFGTREEFLAWEPVTTDEKSNTLRAIRLYQQLLRFHLRDDDRTALLDTDLARLVFGNNKAVGDEKTARFKTALERFSKAEENHEISARALHELAQVHSAAQDHVQARAIAAQGKTKYPESVGGRRCHNLIEQIESRELQLATERVWNDPWPTIDVTYRNLERVHFRVVKFDFEEYARSTRWNADDIIHQQRQALMRLPAVTSWSAALPKTEDYRQRTESHPPPKDLPPGGYFLIASQREDFGEQDNHVAMVSFWVSELALVVRTHQGTGFLDGFVLDAKTGEPIANANVRAWHRLNNGERAALPATQTDKNGLFRIDGAPRHGYLIHVTHQQQTLSNINQFMHVQAYDLTPPPFVRTVLFTDRAIYRPGQMIHVKGITLNVDQREDQYQVAKGRALTLIFQDVNGKEIERLKVQTNDYGSFQGTFTAPRDRLLGQMYLRVEDDPNTMASISVEEYKRPKFQVSIEPPREGARIDGPVKVQGKATAYSGAAIDGAQVRWRVVRQVRYPSWWGWRCWWMPTPNTAAQEIARGTTQTATNGSFEVEFLAKPDRTVAESAEPTFNYTVYADVVDTTGETRSAQRGVNVGYTALSASLSANEWQVAQSPVNLIVRTTTLDGEGQAATGVVKVFALQTPAKVTRASLSGRQVFGPRRKGGPEVSLDNPPPVNAADPNSWPVAEIVSEQPFATDASGNVSISAKLPAGIYRARLETKDKFAKVVTAELPVRVLDPEAQRCVLPVAEVFALEKHSLEPGQKLQAVWGTGYESGRAYVEIEHRQKLLQSYWTAAGTTQKLIEQAVTEGMRGGFNIRVTYVRENRAYVETRFVDVPWSNQQLELKWEHFVSKLTPGQKETFTAVVRGPDALPAVAELVATLYDASLDAFRPHQWIHRFDLFRQDHSPVQSQFENQYTYLQPTISSWQLNLKDGSLVYRHFPADLVAVAYAYNFSRLGRGAAVPGAAPQASTILGARMMKAGAAMDGAAAESKRDAAMDKALAEGEVGQPPAGPDLNQVTARKNLQETAFFFPQLITGKDGSVRLEFTMPEALTEWKFFGFAHDQSMRSGWLSDRVVTAKDLMVQPNPPRFLREGDQLEMTVKVSNQSPTRQQGKVRLTFNDAISLSAVDAQLGNAAPDQAFDLPAGESKSFAWKIRVPDNLSLLTYKAVGATERLSDGEEGFLPVLPRRVLVTESLPLPIRGPGQKEFDFQHLLDAGKSDSLQHKTLTLQMVSNPSWYAVMALPYLMEFPHECSEQTFNRLYANAVARHIALSDPKIRRVFDTWKAAGGDTLDSPLEKNQDLKSVLIEETPWLQQAAKESQARRNIGLLFDDNRLNNETTRLLQKLADLQTAEGLWPWFPGGPSNEYISLYITTGFGRLRRLGVTADIAPAVRSLGALDAWMTRLYQQIPADRREKNHLSPSIALYLYGRSFFLDDQPIDPVNREAVDYYLGQAKRYWLELGNRQSQGHLALGLKRFGDLETARGIMRSLKERSVNNEELGMFWREGEQSWWWYRAPIETQALMIEAFDEVVGDAAAVENCQVWLLKQKQTQDWKTTKATADAVYALLLRGPSLLASSALVDVKLGDVAIQPSKVEAGTGYFEQRFTGSDIRPALGHVATTKRDKGVAWGSLHWQYMEDMSRVGQHAGNPLSLTKTLHKKVATKSGPTLVPVTEAVNVGDEIVVRVVLKADRDFEYVHLKDYRGSGVEPVNVLSQYKFQDGLYYYESTRDTASHFFIDYLPKGTYVFEYSVRVQLKGRYQTGFANLQCMYAPEFNSHSESLLLEVE